MNKQLIFVIITLSLLCCPTLQQDENGIDDQPVIISYDPDYYLKRYEYLMKGQGYNYFYSLQTCVSRRAEELFLKCYKNYKDCYYPFIHLKLENPFNKYTRINWDVPSEFLESFLKQITPDLHGYMGITRQQAAQHVQLCSGIVLSQERCNPENLDDFKKCSLDKNCRKLFIEAGDKLTRCFTNPKIKTFQKSAQCFDCSAYNKKFCKNHRLYSLMKSFSNCYDSVIETILSYE